MGNIQTKATIRRKPQMPIAWRSTKPQCMRGQPNNDDREGYNNINRDEEPT